MSANGFQGKSLRHYYAGRIERGDLWETTTGRTFCKRIIVPEKSVLMSVDIFARSDGSSVGFYMFSLMADRKNLPQEVLWYSEYNATSTLIALDDASGSVPRWLRTRCGVTLDAGAYWISAHIRVSLHLSYATNGADRYFTPTSNWFSDGQFYANTATVNDYAIRASLLALGN